MKFTYRYIISKPKKILLIDAINEFFEDSNYFTCKNDKGISFDNKRIHRISGTEWHRNHSLFFKKGICVTQIRDNRLKIVFSIGLSEVLLFLFAVLFAVFVISYIRSESFVIAFILGTSSSILTMSIIYLRLWFVFKVFGKSIISKYLIK